MIEAFDRTEGRVWAVGDAAEIRTHRIARGIDGVLRIDDPIVIDVHHEGAHVYRIVLDWGESERAIEIHQSIERWIFNRTECVRTELSI